MIRSRRDNLGSALVECALGLPILLFLVLLVVRVTVLCITTLVATYAAYMSGRAASVSAPGDRAIVAFAQAARLLWPMAVGMPTIGADTLTLRHAERLPFDPPAGARLYRGAVTLPFVPFPRRETDGGPKGDNPLP